MNMEHYDSSLHKSDKFAFILRTEICKGKQSYFLPKQSMSSNHTCRTGNRDKVTHAAWTDIKHAIVKPNEKNLNIMTYSKYSKTSQSINIIH